MKPLLLVLTYVLLVLIALIFILPVLFMIMSSLKPETQLMQDAGSWAAFLPVGTLSFANYQSAFSRAPVGLFVLNSLLVTGVTVTFCLFLCSMAGFAFTFIAFKGRRYVLALLVATLIVPFETIAVPLLMLVNKLPYIGFDGYHASWLNSYHVQIVPFLADGLTIFLFTQYFKSIPTALIESARLDGAGWFGIYRDIVVPNAGPVFATAAILKILAMYNQYMWPLMSVQSERLRPVMVGLQYFFQLETDWGGVMAYLCVITVPVLILYFVLQRAFIASIAAVGLKG